MEPLTPAGQTSHGPAEPHAVNVYNYPDEDLFAVSTSEPDRLPNRPGTNTGHGWVWERPDGCKARCGGPAICAECQADQKAIRGGKPDCHSLTCVACGNPTLMADFAPHTATCRACAAAERRLNEAVAPNWSGEP